MKLVVLFVFLIAVLLETSVTTLPLAFLCLLFLTLLFRENWIFVWAFLLGLFLDIFSLGTLGLGSLYFLIFVFLVLSYQKKFEIFTLPFVVITSFVGSFLYLFFFVSVRAIFLQASFSAVLASICFFILQRFIRSLHLQIYD